MILLTRIFELQIYFVTGSEYENLMDHSVISLKILLAPAFTPPPPELFLKGPQTLYWCVM